MSTYHFRVDDHLKTMWMEHAASVFVELIELVHERTTTPVPQYTIAEYKLIVWVECGTITAITIGSLFVVKRDNTSTRCHVVNLCASHVLLTPNRVPSFLDRLMRLFYPYQGVY
jgi:hypothetical protein